MLCFALMMTAVERSKPIGSYCRPSAPLVELGGEFQDHGVCPGIGQCLDAVRCSGTHTLAQTFSLVACALSKALIDVVQLDQIELGG